MFSNTAQSKVRRPADEASSGLAGMESASTAKAWFAAPRAPLIVLGVAALTRYLCVGTWSLWQDEETSIFFSVNLDDPFPRHFPLFFGLLRAVFECTGVSPLAGRILVASLGLLGIAMAYIFSARILNRETAALAAAFLTVSLGHLFWSQSIRYYMLLALFQTVSMYLFVRGFETGSPGRLVASNVFLWLGVLTHLSGALIFPVFVAYMGLSILGRERGGGHTVKGYLTFAIPFAAVCVFFLFQYSSFKAAMAYLVTKPEGSPPLGLLLRIVGYFGLPAFLLSLLAPIACRGKAPRRLLRFFACLAFLPVLELLCIAKLNLVIALWYQAFVAVLGFSVLAAMALVALRERGWEKTTRLLTCVAFLASAPLLLGYYTSMYGDRPRWKEAAEFIKGATSFDPKSATRPIVYSTVAGSMSYYLGSDPAKTKNQQLVREMPPTPPVKVPGSDQWFAVEQDEIAESFRKWFPENCILKAQFEAHTGPKDRTVFVYATR